MNPLAQDQTLAPWERWAGHAGYLAEGMLYLLIGLFALVAAGGRQQPNGSRGALARLGGTLPGDVLLVVLATGLAAFVLWQLVVAFTDPEHRSERHSPRRRLARLEHFLDGVFHSVFVSQAALGLFALSRPDDERQNQARWTARLLALPVGRYLVAVVGIAVIGFGLWQFYRALTRDKNKRVDLSRARLRLAISVLGAYGLVARGVLFALVGGYLVNAAWRHDPHYSGGVAGALAGLKQQPYGNWLLGAVAIGLLCYGLSQVAKEPYRSLGRS